MMKKMKGDAKESFYSYVGYKHFSKNVSNSVCRYCKKCFIEVEFITIKSVYNLYPISKELLRKGTLQ